MSEQVVVKAGQIWVDCDPRMNGRLFKIERVDSKYAYYWLSSGSKPQMKSIALGRMRPRKNGYQLVAESEG